MANPSGLSGVSCVAHSKAASATCALVQEATSSSELVANRWKGQGLVFPDSSPVSFKLFLMT